MSGLAVGNVAGFPDSTCPKLSGGQQRPPSPLGYPDTSQGPFGALWGLPASSWGLSQLASRLTLALGRLGKAYGLIFRSLAASV
jgi:hypothetical protein